MSYYRNILLRFIVSAAQINKLLALVHLKTADVRLPFGKVHFLCQPAICLCSAHTALRPICVENLVCFDTLETQHLIGQITKGANRPPVTTYSGIAVLTLIQLFALQTQPHGRIAVDAFCRHKADNTAAVSANMGYLQPHAPLRSLCGFFAGWLFFRRGQAELCLHIERILRGERQHSRLGDTQRNGSAQCPQAAIQSIYRKAVVTGRLSRQRNDRQCRVGGTDLTGAAKGQPIPIKVQDRPVVHTGGRSRLQCAAQLLRIAQHRKCVLWPRNETVCVHIAAVHEPCGKLKALFHKDELPVSHANGKCILFLTELGQLFQVGSGDRNV